MQIGNSSVYLLYDFAEPDCRCKWCSKASLESGFGSFGGLADSHFIKLESIRIEGQFIRSGIETDGTVWISFRCDGYVQSFSPVEMLNDLVEEKFKRDFWRDSGKMKLEDWDSLFRDQNVQFYLLENLWESYKAYGGEELGPFFDDGKEVKRTNLKKTLREIAAEMLLPDCRKRKYRSIGEGARDYATRYLSFGKEINPESLESTAKQRKVEEDTLGKK
jgi:hypothetical protein